MKKPKERLLLCTLALLLYPALAGAQFELLLPPSGADVTSPPTFEWAAGEYDVFSLYSVFYYEGFGYYPLLIGWYPIASLPLTQGWWDAIAVDVPNYWAVIGLSVYPLAFEIAGAWSFYKWSPCDPDPCEYILNAVPDSCEADGADDFTCHCDAEYTWQGATNACIPGSSSALPDTGIDECYDDTQPIQCPASDQPFFGQDAQYVINPMSYTVGLDELTVTDNVTGLMWQKCTAGLSGPDCSGWIATRTWTDAITYCKGLDLAGHTDWRLPNVKEVQSIVNYGRYNPVIDTVVFPGTNAGWYWSSSTYASDTSNAWHVTCDNGRVNHCDKAETRSVRCVRGDSVARSFTDNLDLTVTDNATGLMWQQEDDSQFRSWESALAYCEDLDLDGHSDWRLPNVKELRSIVDNSRYNPAIDTVVFPGTNAGWYWSSSTYVTRFDAWLVNFYDGYTLFGTKSSIQGYVRCVRGG